MSALIKLGLTLLIVCMGIRQEFRFHQEAPQEHWVCSSYQAYNSRQQCGGGRLFSQKLGAVQDRVECAESCKKAAASANLTTCCIFTDLKTCVAYPGVGKVINGSIVDNSLGVSYRGSGTVCKRETAKISGVSPQEERDLWEYEKPGKFDTGYGMKMRSGHGLALFRNVKTQDIQQGNLGDCWLMALIAAMARYPYAVEQLFLQRFRSPDGQYAIQLYNPTSAQWEWISIDDSLPSTLFGDLQYAKLAADRTLWVQLLEKGVAKLFDHAGLDLQGRKGYKKLDWGFEGLAATILTGKQRIDTFIKHQSQDIWRSTDGLEFDGADPNNFFHRYYHSFWRLTLTEKSVSFPGRGNVYDRFTKPDTIWSAFVQGSVGNRIMFAMIAKKRWGHGETQEGQGLWGGHAYSILKAKEIFAGADHQVCMENISVVYASTEDWQVDSALMKEAWWDGSRRFFGSRWNTSQAAKYGVEEGWSLVDLEAFEGPEPSRSSPRRVVFTGVVEDFECNSDMQQRSGRRTSWITKRINSLQGEDLRLLQVRNPWGNKEMWQGVWNDKDERWRLHPDVADMLGFAPLEDGMWWMPVESFTHWFDRWQIGEVDMLNFSLGQIA
mmetsp:Transcript_26816/g.48445  ORF Transcript_26816/g.48445 Transcript_26816/m.48445 type:complete len:607 (-) Transcript_26816:110-1930(-)|eukprot:CAMPEP_0197632126 /NCGR_PEP_ID=MMETSP1338-20131121/9026_1 /TAXON_ID=43686 ORGANISM="Pelagodinium beii, Strain RCC1491" /NCGR_SAMPLE_ID=MMETSP1338 /ASSEMBLY_ACC=CAM_ASM_000754 /LENGTH=606 /DNA_ID=CAMNT_0043203677 /DNA_START=69 /DNA_END=1889 /DNA_ORIENTATION=-